MENPFEEVALPDEEIILSDMLTEEGLARLSVGDVLKFDSYGVTTSVKVVSKEDGKAMGRIVPDLMDEDEAMDHMMDDAREEYGELAYGLKEED